jgi:four helix bundle protein
LLVAKLKDKNMSSYKDLEIYKLAYELAIRVHKASLTLPPFELYEQGGQIRRSTKSIKDSIAEGFGRRRYKVEFIRYLTFAQASCDEATNQANSIIEIYPNISEFKGILQDLDILGRKINNFIKYVEHEWKT